MAASLHEKELRVRTETRQRWEIAVQAIETLNIDVELVSYVGLPPDPEDPRPSEKAQSPGTWQAWLTEALSRIPTESLTDRWLVPISLCLTDIERIITREDPDSLVTQGLAVWKLNKASMASKAAVLATTAWARRTMQEAAMPVAGFNLPYPWLWSPVCLLPRMSHPLLYSRRNALRWIEGNGGGLGSKLNRLVMLAEAHPGIPDDEALMLRGYYQGYKEIYVGKPPRGESQRRLDNLAAQSFNDVATISTDAGAEAAELVVRLAEGNNQHPAMPWPAGVLTEHLPQLVESARRYLSGPHGNVELLNRFLAARVGRPGAVVRFTGETPPARRRVDRGRLPPPGASGRK